MIEFNSDLINDLARRRVVLFLGAGVSASAETVRGDRIKQWVGFLESAASEIKDGAAVETIKELIGNHSYLFASEIIKKHLGDSWGEIIQDEFGQIASPSALQKAIISLDQRILITTNFDALLENTWSFVNSGNPSKTHQPSIIRSIDGQAFKLLRDDRDYIIKLHGDVGEPESITFDTSSYQKNAYGNAYYKELLSALLLTHTFLFIGFSMADPAISLTVEMFAHRFPGVRPHYILAGGTMQQEVKDLWKKLRKMYVLTYDKADNHKELTESLVQLSAAVKSRQAEIIANQSLNLTPTKT